MTKVSEKTQGNEANTLLPDDLSNFNIWLYYNRYGRTSLGNIDETISEFLKATSGKNKHCNCKLFKGKTVNNIWNDWHCAYCLKPVLNDR